jgi:hypothetical protein
MAGDSIGDKLKEMPPKAWAGIAVCAVLLLVLVWVWWPTTPTLDPNVQKSIAANQNDKEANPPVADVPPPTDGPRRRALKAK